MIVYLKSLYNYVHTTYYIVVEPLMVTTNLTQTIIWHSYSQQHFVTISSIPLLFGHVCADSFVGWVSNCEHLGTPMDGCHVGYKESRVF